jgi:tetratricopeptide (TPR) repeat protein
MTTPQRPKSRDDSIPMYDGSYYLIVTRVMDAVRAEAGVKNKVRGATRELSSLAGHTKKRFSALSLIKKLVVAASFLVAGAGLAFAVSVWRGGSDAESLRRDVKALLAEGDLSRAQEKLFALRGLVGTLGTKDRTELDLPLRAKLEAAVSTKKSQISSYRRAGLFEEALTSLEQLEHLDVDPGYVAWTRAELLRSAGKEPASRQAYADYVRAYPASDLTDDALFWQAMAYKADGDVSETRTLLSKLVAEFPKSNFLTSSKRLLTELPER